MRKIAEEKLIEDLLVKSISGGLTTIKSISQAENLPEYLVREYARKLEEKGLLEFDRTSRPFRLKLSARRLGRASPLIDTKI